MSDPNCLAIVDFKDTYSAMQAALDEKAHNSTFCNHCVKLDLVSGFQAVNSLHLHQLNPNGQIAKQDHGSVFDLAYRNKCPAYRLFWVLLYDGNTNYYKSVCQDLPEAIKDFNTAPRFSNKLRQQFHVDVGIGEAANRTFPVFENPASETDNISPSGIKPLSHQPRDLVMRVLPKTFEDAMKFTKCLGERYLWIDALCIPQDQPDILADQVSEMDEIYSHGLCTIVSLVSGVESGLPGLFVPLSSLGRDSNYAWQTRAWTMQEHLLSKRLVFFEPREVLFVCNEMTTKESWRRPHTANMKKADKTARSDAWSEIPLPLPVTRQQTGLQELFEDIVGLYSSRNLSFPEDRHRAFGGLEGRLSRTYQVRFLHGVPLSPDSDHCLLLSLLWTASVSGPSRHHLIPSTLAGGASALWRTWTWLAHPGASAYRPKRSSMANEQEIEQTVLQLPDPQIHVQADDGTLYSSPQYCAHNSTLSTSRVLKVSTLALDIKVADLVDRLQHTGIRTVWRMCTVLTARGSITFNIGFDLDMLPDSAPRSRAVFPQGRRRFRLLRLDPASQVVARLSPRRRDMEEEEEEGLEDLRRTARRTIPPRTSPYPSRSNATNTGLDIQGVGPSQFLNFACKTESALAANLEWIEPDYPDPQIHSGAAEFDTALLVVEVTKPGTAAERPGVANMRMMDFIVAGAEKRDVLLG
ncbi:hypothetical protein B0T19DRAFT_473632 [Cercophora scortea]|uniref:Heterokaryon incompatibility domain-containing protein n=1 Tax=Cercophora scortea TaxID=314031 RepID=A0AAE0IYF6_9PEZI|nr:hypothetical protein B0T19DRAFT_473632 [Cercophora scortea]